MLNRLATLIATALLIAAGTVCAQEDNVRKGFAARFPQVNIQSVTKLPDLNLYEVIAEGDIYYVDEKVDYVIDGEIILTKTMTNLTKQRKQKLSAIPFNDLPLDLAFKKVKGKGERKVAVFSDPDCPFCKRVENDLGKLDNVTIYMFLYPIVSLHPGAPEVAKRIWCSPDKVKAWDEYMSGKGRPTAAPTCDNPVDKIVEFGRKRNINGTPTLIFATGERVPGAISAAQMETLLNGKAN
jgi:thiol:disulfide interchange protein DsbC